MPKRPRLRPIPFALCAAALLLASSDTLPQEKVSPNPAPLKSDKTSSPPQDHNEQLDLQKAIEDAANDRAALVRNLEGFLKTYPESQQRLQIYRAIVESSLKVEDFPRATEYAERMVSLRPDDASINILAIQLLERYGDPAGWRRGISHCTRVIEQIRRTSIADKSPRVSAESWQADKKRDEASVLLVRGHLYQKLNDVSDAQKDYELSYSLTASVTSAARLGELAESRKDLDESIKQYARAFALSADANGPNSRAELRKKIGNDWRLAHGSDNGLGDYLLRAFDEIAASSVPAKPLRNAGLKNPYDFTLRRAPGGAPFPLAETRGKVVVLNFWATWCGPCRELEPHFEKIAAHYAAEKDIQFFQLNCDDDESLVPPFLEEEKPKTTILYADTLEVLFSVNAFPTTMILGRDGKIAFRADGFDPATVDKDLSDAIERALHAESLPSPSSTTATSQP